MLFFLKILIEKEFHDALDKLLEVLGVESPFSLVVQVSKERLVQSVIAFLFSTYFDKRIKIAYS